MIMQETNAFGTSDLIMQSAEQNPLSGNYQKNWSLNLCSVAVGLYGKHVSLYYKPFNLWKLNCIYHLGPQGFREFNFGETGFNFSNSAASTGSAGFNFGEATDKSTEMPGFSFGNSFQFGGNSSTGDKCDNFLSVFDTEKDGGQMESQETSFSFSFGGFQ